MVKATKKKKDSLFRQHKTLIIVLTTALLASLAIIASANYLISSRTYKIDYPSTDSKVPYVDGRDASDQVANFYRQYLDARTPMSVRPKLIEAYGNKNLLFYSQYYQHGFDPITCSVDMPIKVTATLVSTGPVATVDAIAEKPDGTIETIKARVILDDEGLSIDSIKCPGAKGELLPGSI